MDIEDDQDEEEEDNELDDAFRIEAEREAERPPDVHSRTPKRVQRN
jgi:hypothetical protein